MTDYEPARIYSGIVDGTRRMLLRRNTTFGERWATQEGDCADDDVAEIRGPLVVLDLSDHAQRSIADLVRHLREDDDQFITDDVADQIEQQTHPPLQIGWHEMHTKNTDQTFLLHWDGQKLTGVAGIEQTRALWVSVHFIGPGSADA